MREEKREMMELVSANSILKQIWGLSRTAEVGRRAAQATAAERGQAGPGPRRVSTKEPNR